MKTLIVHVEQQDGTFWGTSENLPGVISTFGDSLQELKKSFNSALNDHIETLEEINDETLEETKQFTEIKFKMNVQSVLNLVPELNLSSISLRAKTPRSALSRYKTGKEKYISEKKAKQLEDALHNLGKELLSVKLV